MTDDDVFLRAILQNPADDTPRLIYADWLDERGEPRGEFIRIQCRLAQLAATAERRPLLEQSERELLDHHQDRWLGSLRSLLSAWTFRRGFLDEITIPAAIYLQNPAFHRPATVRHVKVDLNGFEAPRPVVELVPESLARENILQPLGVCGRTLIVAVQEPIAADLLTKMQFILNRNVEMVAAEQVVEAIDRHYQYQADELEVVTNCLTDPPLDYEDDIANDRSPYARLLDLIIAEAMALHAEYIRLQPQTDCVQVFYRIGNKWIERDSTPLRLLLPLVARIRHLAHLAADEEGIEQVGLFQGVAHRTPYNLHVHIRPTNLGPHITLRFLPSANEGSGGTGNPFDRNSTLNLFRC
jgi:uncharacterized protein (TIGR02996 family)